MSGRPLGILALVLLASACAAAPETAPSEGGATLELVNRTHDDLTVGVRGRVEATLRPGSRVRVHELLPGPAPLIARATTGGAGAFEARHEVVLARGETVVWSILPDAAGGAPLDEPPALWPLVVQNTTPSHVMITFDGVAIGRVFAGQTRTFHDLPAGPHDVAATPDDGTLPIRERIEVPADGPAAWLVSTAGATLEVVNRTNETLALAVDGHERAHIRAGDTWRGTVALGTHVASAVSEPSRRPYERTLTITADGPHVVWEVSAGQAGLVVDNQTGEPIAVSVLGRAPLDIAAGAQVPIDDVPTGRVDLVAVGTVSKLTYAGRIDLQPGQRAHWIVEPIAASVRIVNRTSRALWIYRRAGAKSPEVKVGTIEPDQVALIRELPRAPLYLAAVDPVGKRRYETTLDLSDLPAETWTVQAETGSIAVKNERDEPVTVYVDAAATGEVPAHGSRTFPGLAVGRRLVESVGQRTGYVQKHQATVLEDRVFAVTLPDPSAFVVVDNATGEALETRGALAAQTTTIAPGATYKFRVRDGMVRLVVVGRDTGLTYQSDVMAKASEPARWVVSQTPATLTVWNQLAESIALTIDDRAHGSVSPDKTLTVPELAPGRHTVQAVGLTSGSLRTETVVLEPGADERLSLTLRLGVLVVENRAAEPVNLHIDGRPYGTVAGGAIQGFANIPPGHHKVTFDYTKSRRFAATEIDVREGQRAKVVAEVPLAPVVVANGARQDVRVRVDGEFIATIGNDAPPALIHIPAGERLVQFERVADHTIVSYRLDFWADTALHLPVPPKTVRLVVVNRLQHTAEIRRAERVIGRIEAGSSALIEDLEDGEARLFARDPDGNVTHAEARRIAPGETATWVLEAPAL